MRTSEAIPEQDRKSLLAVFLLSSVILTLRSIHLDGPDIVMDDAYISFRYAVNLSNGLGLVYNPGERVEGYTNFLWTILLAAGSYLGFDIILYSKLLAWCAGVATLFLLYLFAIGYFEELGGSLLTAGLPMLLFSMLGSQARYVVSGMETLLFTLLLTLAIYLLVRAKLPALSGAAFALAALTRPEGVLYFVITAGYAILFFRQRAGERARRWDTLFPFAASFLAIYGVYFVSRALYYGYPLPNTFYAKASGLSPARWLRGWDYLAQVIRQWRIEPLLALSLFSVLSSPAHRVWYLFFGAVVATMAYFVYVGGDFIVWFGPRFLMPVLPLLLLMSARGAGRLANRVPARADLRLASRLLVAGLLCFGATWYSWPARFDRLEGFAAQMRAWKELGLWMAGHLPPETTIATDAAGLIPFYSRLRAIDMFGLTDEHIAHLDRPGAGAGIVAHEKFDPLYVLERNPECLVSTWMSAEGQPISAGLDTVAGDVQRRYRLVAVTKVRYGPPADGRWVIVTRTYTPGLYEAGYQSGLFCREGAVPAGGGEPG